MGTLSVCAFAFVVSLILAIILKVTVGIRVSAEEEQKGLDVEEHGAPAYHFGTDANEMS
jgi:Amt family ammonium transporter